MLKHFREYRPAMQKLVNEKLEREKVDKTEQMRKLMKDLVVDASANEQSE